MSRQSSPTLLRHLTALTCALIFSAAAVLAQTTLTSTILGEVTDPQSAAVPGTEVVLHETQTGVDRRVVTNGNGEYVFANLNPGTYQIEVRKEGFRTTLSQPAALTNGAKLRVNISLLVGQVSENITISSAAPVIETDQANVGQVLQQQLVRDIPIEGRNFTNYLELSPQFNSGSGDNSQSAYGLATSTRPGAKTLNLGGTEYGVGYYVDGFNINDNWVAGPTTNINVDTIQEVKTDVINYSAEYGRDIGQLNVTTKSGTNDLHGTGFWFRQNSGLNARDPYAIYEDPTVARNDYHQNQAGFTVGGPVIIPKLYHGRNKFFFFVGYEGLRNDASNNILAYVPTARERTGDFGEWLERFPGASKYVIYDPYSFNAATQERTPYPNNIITRVDPRAAAYVSHFPLPNYTSTIAEDFRNWKGTQDQNLTGDNTVVRGDYTFGPKDSAYFKYSYDSGSRRVDGGLIPELALGGTIHHSTIYSGHYVHTFTPTFLNDFSVGYLTALSLSEDPSKIKAFESVPWFRDLLNNTSISGGGLSPFDRSTLQVNDDGIYGTNFGGDGLFSSLNLGTGEYYYQVIPQTQIADDVTKIIGKHTLKMGFHWFRRDERDNDIIRSVSFGGGYTGRGPQFTDGSGWDSLAEFMTGAVTSMTQRTNNTGGDNSLYFRSPEWAGYINDSWQVNNRLTVSLGIRYELAPQAYSVNNYWGVLDQNYPGLRMYMPGLTPGTDSQPFPADKNNFAPRIGLAYRLSDKWVVRSGYGIFYETGRYKFMDQMFFNAPGYGGSTYASADYSAVNGSDPNAVYFTLENSFPASLDVPRGDWPIPLGEKGGILYPRQDTYTIDKNTATAPYTQRWSFDVQRQIGASMVASLSYAGSKSTKLPIADDLNLPPEGVYLNSDEFHQARPNSQNPDYIDRFGSILAIHHGGNSTYESLTAKFERRFTAGMTLLAHYTLAKQEDEFFNNNGYSNASVLGGQWHRDWAHGLSDADHRHRAVVTVTYELPFGRNLKGISGMLAKGWQVNALGVFESGSPASVYNGDTSSFDYMGDVPVRVCDGNLSRGDRTFNRYFDTSCFVNPPDLNGDGIADYRGNSGRNVITLPGISNWDMSAMKRVYIGENRSLEFRWETFNTFNHTQWSSVNTYNDTGVNPASTFGRIDGGRPGRHMQWGLKFNF